MKHRTGFFERIAHAATVITGTTAVFICALLIIVVWLITGPLFHFSDTWQLVINTGTTVITFLMVFLIQRMQNKDSMAIHLKLNELVASLNGASNRLIDVESLSEDELLILSKYYHALAELARKDKNVAASHSIEEAVKSHSAKHHKKIIEK